MVGKVRECDMPALSFTLSCSRSREEWKINCVLKSDSWTFTATHLIAVFLHPHLHSSLAILGVLSLRTELTTISGYWEINTCDKHLVAFSRIPPELNMLRSVNDKAPYNSWQDSGILRNNSTSRYTAVNYSDVRCGGRQRKWQLGDSSLIIVLLLWPLWNKWSYLSGSEVCWREEKAGFYLAGRREKGICKKCSANRISEW